jgi:polyhydroxyalkanoate synthesis regulator phasin
MTSETPEEKNIIERLIGMGEERLETIVQELLTNPKVIQVMSKVIQRTQEARTLLEERLRQVYQLANIPTQAELKRLEDKLVELEHRLASLKKPRTTPSRAGRRKTQGGKATSRRKKR